MFVMLRSREGSYNCLHSGLVKTTKEDNPSGHLNRRYIYRDYINTDIPDWLSLNKICNSRGSL